MTFRYIGSKSRLIDQITAYMGHPKQGAFFVDAFCGTGVVAEAAADLGWNVRINDSLHSAVISAGARLISTEQAAFKKLGGYAKAIAKLNAAKPKHGFMWREYSPASMDTSGLERRYFTQENAARIDAMRSLIGEWVEAGTIDEVEERLLIADLFGALNRVANIAGTFGCFLSKWTSQSQDKIAMRCRELKASGVRVEATVGDVFDVPNAVDDLVYLDPPYTKRQYASYYHILETVALGDEPEVEGVAGLRPWRVLASDFCYKTRALKTLSRLVSGLKAQKVLLSYSSEGHISMPDMKAELSKIGKSTMHPLGAIGRYRPNKVGSRAASSLRLNYNPISVDAKGARAIDFAGLIRLAPSLELEVAPKFLGLDDIDAAWREDFFFLSTLSRHGRLLASERLSASGGTPRDLSTLVARSITSMYEARKRRPLRSYRRVREADFFIDGDPDPVDLIFPSPDGFEQELIRFDRKNGWNGDIVAAAKELLPEVSDPSAASSLVRLIEDLSPQNAPANRRKPIPARHRAWKPMHELSIDVLGGLGLNYKQGQAHAPGYLVDTWRVWEDLLTVAARLGFGRNAVVPQRGYPLGTKTKISTGAVSKLSVYPDCVIEPEGTRPRMLLDAKYKGHVEKGQLRISEADIYEALAFSKATGCNLVALAYPAQPGDAPQPVGTCTVFEKAVVDAVQIVGIQIESRLISKTGALRVFAANMAAGVAAAFA